MRDSLDTLQTRYSNNWSVRWHLIHRDFVWCAQYDGLFELPVWIAISKTILSFRLCGRPATGAQMILKPDPDYRCENSDTKFWLCLWSISWIRDFLSLTASHRRSKSNTAKDLSAAKGHHWTELFLTSLGEMHKEESFNTFWESINKTFEDLDVNELCHGEEKFLVSDVKPEIPLRNCNTKEIALKAAVRCSFRSSGERCQDSIWSARLSSVSPSRRRLAVATRHTNKIWILQWWFG